MLNCEIDKQKSIINNRVAIFIDGSNCYHSIKELFSIHDNIELKADGFKRIIEFLKQNKTLVFVNYYNAPLDRNHNSEIYSKQQKFFAELKRIPGFNVILCRRFNVILCRMSKIRDKQGNVVDYKVKGDDIHIAVDMVRLAYEDAYDTAILVSGDGDSVPAIKVVQKLGKRVENAYFSVSSSSYLKNVCDTSILLDIIIRNILEKK